MIAAITAFITFYYQRFFLFGAALGVISIYLNASLPYPHVFQHCDYQADIAKANYSQRRQGKLVLIDAQNIRCDGQHLPNQTLQLWDNHGQFDGLENYRLTLQSQLHPIKARLNPHVVDYEKTHHADGIRLSAKHLELIATDKHKRPILHLRKALSWAITEQLSARQAGIVLALITGNRSALSQQQKHLMQQTGTSHLLAISGLHLGLVGGLAWLIGQWAWAMSWRLSDRLMPIQAGGILAFFVISTYALLTGFEIPIQRAWIMFSLLILSWLWLKSASQHALLFAAVVVLFVQPYAVVSLGFYFSFIATFIVLWSARLPYNALIKILIMQGLINIVLLPITWQVFGSIPLTAVIVNLLVIPWLGLWVLPWAIAACLIHLVSPTLSQPLWQVVDFNTAAMEQTLAFFSDLNLSLNPVFSPTLAAVIIVVISLLLALISRKKIWLLGCLFIFVPINKAAIPTLIVADNRYTSALIDNGKSAILINPGRRYQHLNQAKKWHRYLQQRGVSLAVIILQNDKISRISATAWLLDKYPHAQVIRLQDFPTPYHSQYCQSFYLENLQLMTRQQRGGCQAQLQWFGQAIQLFEQSKTNAILPKSQLKWQGKNYHSQALGAVSIQRGVNKEKVDFSLSYLRQKQRLWRIKISPADN